VSVSGRIHPALSRKYPGNSDASDIFLRSHTPSAPAEPATTTQETAAAQSKYYVYLVGLEVSLL
jgi:hypothetical protein